MLRGLLSKLVYYRCYCILVLVYMYSIPIHYTLIEHNETISLHTTVDIEYDVRLANLSLYRLPVVRTAHVMYCTVISKVLYEYL